MGEAKRNKARLGEWYGKPITAGHPDAPKPKASPTMLTAAPQHTVSERVEHKTTNEQKREDAPQGTPVASEYITGVDPATPGSDRTAVAVHRPNQSTFATMAMLACVMLGSAPGFGEAIETDDDRKNKS